MKKLLGIIGLTLLLMAPTFASADDYRANYGSGTTSAVVVLPTVANLTPVVTGYNATSDKAGSYLDVYVSDATYTTVTTSASVEGENATSQKILVVTATTGFDATTPGAGDYVVIQNLTTGAVQWNQISSITDGVSLNMVNDLTAAAASGISVKEMKQVAAIPVGNTTVSAYGNALGILGGSRRSPVLAVLDGTSACAVNLLSATYK